MQMTVRKRGEKPKPTVVPTNDSMLEDALHDICIETGWTPRYQIEILCSFIESIHQSAACLQHLTNTAKEGYRGSG